MFDTSKIEYPCFKSYEDPYLLFMRHILLTQLLLFTYFFRKLRQGDPFTDCSLFAPSQHSKYYTTVEN